MNTTTIKRYTRHYCPRNHRTLATLARCLWPRAHWITGHGTFACVSKCRGTTVTIWPDLDQAQHAKDLIDAGACGGACVRRHEIIAIGEPAQMRAAA